MENDGKDEDPRWQRLLGLAVHELRSPLGVVTGYLLMFERAGSLSDKQLQFLGEVKKSADKLKTFVDEMSELVRLEDGERTAVRGRIDVTSMLNDVIAAVGAEPEREVRITLKNEAAGSAVHGDPVKLRKAIGSVIWALRREMMTNDELIVHLKRELDAGKRQLRISVGDEQRIGALSRAELGQLVRFHEWRGGCGYRLPIARRIIAAHQGRLWSPAAEPSEPTDDRERNPDQASKARAVIVLPEIHENGS
jgi:signal transduction histidine kinase